MYLTDTMIADMTNRGLWLHVAYYAEVGKFVEAGFLLHEACARGPAAPADFAELTSEELRLIGWKVRGDDDWSVRVRICVYEKLWQLEQGAPVARERFAWRDEGF